MAWSRSATIRRVHGMGVGLVCEYHLHTPCAWHGAGLPPYTVFMAWELVWCVNTIFTHSVHGMELGQLLLRGWAMLAETCPSCQVSGVEGLGHAG
eukprot:363941-Chlamydomonas_euryale.AAC.9